MKSAFRFCSGSFGLGFLASILFSFALTAAAAESAIAPDDLTCERLDDPLGIDAAAPRLSWVNEAADDSSRDLSQSAYRILAASSEKALERNDGDLWDSGWVESDENLDIAYAGKPLRTSQRVWWKVAVRDQDGNESAWSEPARWIAGVMDPADWKASWIGQPAELRGEVNIDGASWIGLENADAKELFVRREFTLDATRESLDKKELTAAYRYAGNQQFELYVNNKRVGFSLGMIYNPDLLRSIDITEYLVPGKNLVSAKVWVDKPERGQPAFFAKIEIQKIDAAVKGVPERGTPGETVTAFGTDTAWQASDRADGGWTNAKKLYDADGGPWGKLRRFSEKNSPAFAKTFTLAEGKTVAEATLHITGLGFYEASLDGKKIGKKLLDPAPTRFDKTVLYSTYDVTESLSDGREHRFDVLLGHGWYDVRSVVTWNFDASPWRDFPRMIAQLEIRYDDGTQETVLSDDSWECVTSPVVFDCIRQGEIVDGGFERKTLGSAAVVEPPKGRLTAEALAPTTIIEEFPAKGVEEISPNVWLVDLGANIAGWCRVKFNGLEKGQVVRLRYAERSAVDGKIDRFALDKHFLEGTAAFYAGQKGGFQTDFYIAAGKDGETFEPRFTYNGFQYVEVTGVESAPNPADFTACVVSNDFETVGEFECSNDLLNAIQRATLSSYHANFVDGYPTDCPQREKNGWTGDAHLACELAMFNFENTAGYEKWLRDLRDEQRDDGNLAAIIPTSGWGYFWGNGPAWDSSLVLIPWYNYIYKGDRRILEENYDAMKKYVDYMTTRADGRFLLTHGLGDWISVETVTPVEVTSTGYWFVDTNIVARAAELLGKSDDAKKYRALAEKIAAAFHRELNKGNGVFSIGSQAAESCALYQGFVTSDEERKAAVERLAEQVEARNRTLDIGILGLKYLLRSLSEGGRTDLALAMMLREEQPSFADWLRRGGGTLWEDWKDGDSRNHIMFGDVSAWFYQYLAGIRLAHSPAVEVALAAPEKTDGAFKEFLIAPCCSRTQIAPTGFEPLKSVKAELETVRGEIKSSWKWNDDFTRLTLDVEIPVGSRATVILPLDTGDTPKCETLPELQPTRTDGEAAYSVGSGSYTFTIEQTNSEKTMTDTTNAPLVAALSQLKPDAAELARYPETVRRGIEWLKTTDLAALPLGRQEIDGEAIYANVQEYETKPVEEFMVEAHRKYIDIQLVAAGRELIGVAKMSDALPVSEPYSDEKDCLFLEKSAMPFLLDGSDSPGRIALAAGELAIFTHDDPHAPCLALDKPEKVRKIVVKCRIKP